MSRHKAVANKYSDSVLLHSNHVREQLAELRDTAHLSRDRSAWFGRCLICGVLLEEAQRDKASENVPEYVFYQNMTEIRFCPSCGRYYWPGTHRKKMARQLEEWGF